MIRREKERQNKMATSKTWESSSRMNTTSPFNLRGFLKNDQKQEMEKPITATKFHDIIGMLDTHTLKWGVSVYDAKKQQANFSRIPCPILVIDGYF